VGLHLPIEELLERFAKELVLLAEEGAIHGGRGYSLPVCLRERVASEVTVSPECPSAAPHARAGILSTCDTTSAPLR
jgi:hypothetical protein